MVEGVRRTLEWDRAAISSRTSAAVRHAVGRFRPFEGFGAVWRHQTLAIVRDIAVSKLKNMQLAFVF